MELHLHSWLEFSTSSSWCLMAFSNFYHWWNPTHFSLVSHDFLSRLIANLNVQRVRGTHTWMPFGDLQRSTYWLTLYQTYHFTSTLPHNSVVFSTDDLILKSTLSGILIQKLGGGFNFFFKISPLFGEDEPILTSIFFRWGWFQPPISKRPRKSLEV